MFKSESQTDAPTMILPRGVDIDVDEHGQLSIRTPGNLVVQNSGRFAHLESVGGSITIEEGVTVEAVTVGCAQTCLVQGELTAWRVGARSIHLDRSARANIILQEAEELVIGQDARLVGNFGSENELLGLFSRYARQIREVPFPALPGETEEGKGAGRGDGDPRGEEGGVEVESSRPLPRRGGDLPEPLLFAAVLLERELERRPEGPISRRVLEELLELVEGGDLELLKRRYDVLFRRLSDPGRDARRAAEMISRYFDERAAGERPADGGETGDLEQPGAGSEGSDA